MTTALPARAARLAAGLSLADAARRARVSEAHLRACERANTFALLLARRLAELYACPIDVFLPKRTTGPRTHVWNTRQVKSAARRAGRSRRT